LTEGSWQYAALDIKNFDVESPSLATIERYDVPRYGNILIRSDNAFCGEFQVGRLRIYSVPFYQG